MLADDQLITMTVGQFRDAVSYAVEKAIKPLQAKVSALEDSYARLKEENAALGITQGHLADNQEIQLRLIKELKATVHREPQPLQKDRADLLKALLMSNGGQMLAKEARKKMHIKKNHFAELLKICDFVDTKPYHLDRRQTVIILKSELVRGTRD